MNNSIDEYIHKSKTKDGKMFFWIEATFLTRCGIRKAQRRIEELKKLGVSGGKVSLKASDGRLTAMAGSSSIGDKSAQVPIGFKPTDTAVAREGTKPEKNVMK